LKRKLIDTLIEWKNSYDPNHKTKRQVIPYKPILLCGAKGVGKTYLAYDFAKSFFDQIYYINMENGEHLSGLFSKDESVIESKPENTIIILDEIPFNSETMREIKQFLASRSYPFILAISSKPITDEGKEIFQTLPVYPMEFDEFLTASGNEWYIEVIMTHFASNKKIPEIVHKELLALHQLYLQIGGMPGAINEFINMASTINIMEQHRILVSAYYDCIRKFNSDSEALKMKQVFDSLSLQLLKDNKKFQYNLIRKGTTSAMYKEAIQKLTENHYAIQCNKIAGIGLKEEDASNFKLYLPDTGLLYTQIKEAMEAQTDLHVKSKQTGKNKMIRNRDKALLENYVAQSLQARGYSFGFWESNSMAKIDFIIEKDQSRIPIEIHCSNNTRSKSISVLKQHYQFPYAIKISSKNFDFSNQIKYIPYYAVFCL